MKQSSIQQKENHQDPASLEKFLQLLRKEGEDQKKILTSELDQKFGITYHNCRRIHDTVLDHNGKKLGKQLLHFLQADCRVKDLENYYLKKEIDEWKRFCQHIFGWSGQPQGTISKQELKTVTINVPMKGQITLTEHEIQLEKELIKLRMKYDQVSQELQTLLKKSRDVLKEVKVDIIQQEFKEEQTLIKNNESQLLIRKISIMMNNLNDNEQMLNNRNKQISLLKKQLKSMEAESGKGDKIKNIYRN